MPYLRVILSSLLNAAVYGSLLFAPAGTLHWWRAWVLLALVLGAMIVTRLSLLRDGGDLFAERRRAPFQRGQPVADKVLVVGFLFVFPAYLAFIPVDVFHLHLLVRPAAPVAAFGLLPVGAGLGIIAFAFYENRFAAGIVIAQAARGQAVVDRGVYGVVRHPLYAGVLLVVVGAALWLQSYAAVIASFGPLALIVARIIVEERFLVGRLAGYLAYTERIRSRLIPRIW